MIDSRSHVHLCRIMMVIRKKRIHLLREENVVTRDVRVWRSLLHIYFASQDLKLRCGCRFQRFQPNQPLNCITYFAPIKRDNGIQNTTINSLEVINIKYITVVQGSDFRSSLVYFVITLFALTMNIKRI